MKLRLLSIKYKLVLCFVSLLLFSSALVSQNLVDDTIPLNLGENVKVPIYKEGLKNHGKFYRWAWGNHYNELYYQPVTAKTIVLDSVSGTLAIRSQLPKLHALILNDAKDDNLYILRPLGGSSSFVESKFFRNVYKQEDFKGTYLNDFIKDAYTVVHPYMFIVSDRLAQYVGLGQSRPSVYYVAQANQTDTIADGTQIKDKLVSISRLPDIVENGVVNDVDSMLNILHHDNLATVDREMYIKARLFDMLIGDWNKISENWYWIPVSKGDSVVYVPQSIDRGSAFSKVDGVFFKQLINMLGVGFITDYEPELKNVKKFNKLSYPLDIAITQNCTLDDWMQQADILKKQLTDNIIDAAFSRLPQEMQNDDSGNLRSSLKQRRNDLSDIARWYYEYIQRTPVITGTDQNERIVVEQGDDKMLRIRIFDKETGRQTLDKTYSDKITKEIWLYGLGGDDTFEIDKRKRDIPLLLIGGEGTNDYNVSNGKRVSIYESKDEKERLKQEDIKANVIIPNKDSALVYDYQKVKYSTISVTPIGIYDSDLGLNIGTSVAYTIYGFKRAPYTRRHQLSYDYTNGFTYQGIFPSFDEKKSLHIAAYVGSPAYFSNFFGFGNNTEGYKDEKKNYNRVNINKYMLTPSLYYNISKEQTLSVFSSFEVYKVKNPSARDRFVNTVYDDDSRIFSTQYYANLGATYEFNKNMEHFVSAINLSSTLGWNVNFGEPARNYPYAKASFAIHFKFSDRISLATQIKGTSLFSNDYEFYQAATTELRGFRDNRFIGKHSVYQYSDIRYDMGKLQNPFAPLKYGLFVGADHGRVWYQGEDSNKWHSSYGGGFWLTVLRKFTGKFSYFGSNDGSRFMFQLGMGF